MGSRYAKGIGPKLTGMDGGARHCVRIPPRVAAITGPLQTVARRLGKPKRTFIMDAYGSMKYNEASSDSLSYPANKTFTWYGPDRNASAKLVRTKCAHARVESGAPFRSS